MNFRNTKLGRTSTRDTHGATLQCCLVSKCKNVSNSWGYEQVLGQCPSKTYLPRRPKTLTKPPRQIMVGISGRGTYTQKSGQRVRHEQIGLVGRDLVLFAQSLKLLTAERMVVHHHGLHLRHSKHNTKKTLKKT